MFNIKEYLEKFRVMSQSQSFLRDSVVDVVKDVCGVDIDKQKITVKNYIVKINEKPIVKTTVFLKKIKILEILNIKTNGKIKDIL